MSGHGACHWSGHVTCPVIDHQSPVRSLMTGPVTGQQSSVRPVNDTPVTGQEEELGLHHWIILLPPFVVECIVFIKE
ncbi:hypothetical protein DPMN_105431 [Dreissena polymorpha]|uniref:Uncharacterized protein n=1 Tax=Dreissena polymorpha TaxID=45954 RepID=A0A9D4HER1_DREPO|nr:hypothetical protein DPMN_105431 [Dreissena polymorpha]